MKPRKILAASCIAFIAITTILLSCGESSSNPPAGNASVTIQDMSFGPATITVTQGTVVKWTNQDVTDHTVTSNDGTSFNSTVAEGGGVFSYTANTVGTFDYHCNFHPMMTGTLIVTAP